MQQHRIQQQREHENQYLTFAVLDTIMHADGGTVTHTGTSSAYGKAISGRAFPDDRPFVFVVQIDALPNHGAMCGVISNPAAQSPYYNDITCYGWYSSACVIKAGKGVSGDGGWAGWQQGDEGVMRYSPLEHSLQMFHRRLDRVFAIHDLPNIPFYLSLVFHCANSCVRVRAATEDDTRASRWE
jgi:hypothetical protein